MCDYFGKSGFFGVIIGFFGGIDLVLILCVVVDVLGVEKVCVVMMLLFYIV